ncbi:hypothetical protein DLAC_11456 [Tieghemostelium lacteum]|uniref:Uncharacterized protein n=1 Tax=Tieghemostelium lacteum TaxID=361077 RepID=A0A152A7B2_TIELA|nr:hypothetical protein DLAC_11456 [Tieghemostelium lacteum]|eukprot:KYR02120.1 hypothetical protein DLAC_11456 [Tieghemostelium lacteum]
MNFEDLPKFIKVYILRYIWVDLEFIEYQGPNLYLNLVSREWFQIISQCISKQWIYRDKDNTQFTVFIDKLKSPNFIYQNTHGLLNHNSRTRNFVTSYFDSKIINSTMTEFLGNLTHLDLSSSDNDYMMQVYLSMIDKYCHNLQCLSLYCNILILNSEVLGVFKSISSKDTLTKLEINSGWFDSSGRFEVDLVSQLLDIICDHKSKIRVLSLKDHKVSIFGFTNSFGLITYLPVILRTLLNNLENTSITSLKLSLFASAQMVIESDNLQKTFQALSKCLKNLTLKCYSLLLNPMPAGIVKILESLLPNNTTLKSLKFHSFRVIPRVLELLQNTHIRNINLGLLDNFTFQNRQLPLSLEKISWGDFIHVNMSFIKEALAHQLVHLKKIPPINVPVEDQSDFNTLLSFFETSTLNTLTLIFGLTLEKTNWQRLVETLQHNKNIKKLELKLKFQGTAFIEYNDAYENLVKKVIEHLDKHHGIPSLIVSNYIPQFQPPSSLQNYSILYHSSSNSNNTIYHSKQ